MDTRVRVYRDVRSRTNLDEVWRSLRVARLVGLRDMRLRYTQSLLGPVWILLQPLGMLAGLAIAFAGVTKVDTGGIPYLLFALVGVSVWSYIQTTVATTAGSLVANGPLVRRTTCPRVAIVDSALLANLPTLLIMASIATVVSAIWTGPRLEMLAVPLLIAWTLACMWGPALLLSAAAAHYRDVVAVIPLVMQVGTFATPVGYPLDQTSGTLRTVISLNPFTGILEAWRWAILGTAPAAMAVVASLAVIVVFAVVGWRVFTRLEPRIADRI